MAQYRSAETALDYVRGLSPGVKANCWSLAEAAGHDSPYRMQALLRSYRRALEQARRIGVLVIQRRRRAARREDTNRVVTRLAWASPAGVCPGVAASWDERP